MKDNGFKQAKERSRRYPTQTTSDADYADDIALLANTPAQGETLLHGLKRAAASKTEYMCFDQRGDISTLNGSSLKLVDKFTYLGSSVSSTEKDVNTRLVKAWIAIDRLLIIWKSDLTDKIKRSFFQATVGLIVLYGCTTWTLTKRMEKKLEGNYTRMLRAVLNKSWRQQPTKNQLEPIYNSSVLIQGVALKTSPEQWVIDTGGERGSGKSVLAAWHHDDDIQEYFTNTNIFM